jgi:Flp pilus assembly pilin Flp
LPVGLRIKTPHEADALSIYFFAKTVESLGSNSGPGCSPLFYIERLRACGRFHFLSNVNPTMSTEFSKSNYLAGKHLSSAGLVRETDGSTGVEYAIVVALMTVGMLASVQAIGTGTRSLLQSFSTSLKAAGPESGAASALGKTPEEAPTTFF